MVIFHSYVSLPEVGIGLGSPLKTLDLTREMGTFSKQHDGIQVLLIG
jgi:hypothetical protein